LTATERPDPNRPCLAEKRGKRANKSRHTKTNEFRRKRATKPEGIESPTCLCEDKAICGSVMQWINAANTVFQSRVVVLLGAFQAAPQGWECWFQSAS